MYDLSTKSSFIYFRSQGLTIEKVSKLMGINRTTLIQWNKQFFADIKIAERDALEQILDDNFCEKRRRVELLAKMLDKAYFRLDEKDTSISTLDTLREIEKLTRLLNLEMEDRKFTSLVMKSSESVQKDFPVIVNNVEKYNEYDPDYRPEPYDVARDEYGFYTEEERQEAKEKAEEEDRCADIVRSSIEKLEELDLREAASKFAVNIPDSEFEKTEEVIDEITKEITKEETNETVTEVNREIPSKKKNKSKSKSEGKVHKRAKIVLNKIPEFN